jgi:hypothetical protein
VDTADYDPIREGPIAEIIPTDLPDPARFSLQKSPPNLIQELCDRVNLELRADAAVGKQNVPSSCRFWSLL